MGAEVMTADDDIRDKIKIVLNKLEKMESRVKTVETVAAAIPKLEKTMQTIVPKLEKGLAAVALRLESGQELTKPIRMPSGTTPPPIRAFISGASIGILIVGVITAAWVLGFF